jgi:acetoacetate decarboxylase
MIKILSNDKTKTIYINEVSIDQWVRDRTANGMDETSGQMMNFKATLQVVPVGQRKSGKYMKTLYLTLDRAMAVAKQFSETN